MIRLLLAFLCWFRAFFGSRHTHDLLRDGKPPKGWPLERDPWLLGTSVPAILVAGDLRHGSVKRVACSVGEGANAVQFVHQYFKTV